MNDVRKELGVCMQYDVHFDHLTTEEHLLLYGHIKAPHWSKQELQQQVRRYVNLPNLPQSDCMKKCFNPYSIAAGLWRRLGCTLTVTSWWGRCLEA